MVIKNDSDATTKENTIAIYPAEDTAATFKDNKNLDYISSLGATAIWSAM
jgi:glycosidase